MYTSIVFIEWKRQWISIPWHRHHHWWSKTRRKNPHEAEKKHKQRRTKLSKIGQAKKRRRRRKKNQRVELTLITSTTVLSSSSFLFLFRLRPPCLLVYSICVLFFFSLIPSSSLSHFRYSAFTLRLCFGKFCVFAFGRSIAKHRRFRHCRRKP